MAINVILSKSKNIFFFKMHFQCFYFLKVENKKSNQIYFQNSNFLKMKTVFKKEFSKNEN